MSEDIQRFMGRVEAKLDALIESLTHEKDAIRERFKDQESRLRALETWRWKTVGIATASGGLLGFLIKLIP